MTSNLHSGSATSKFRSKTFPLLLHFASLIVLIACVYCIIVLFRDLRRLEALLNQKTPPVEIEKQRLSGKAEENVRVRRSQNDADTYETTLLDHSYDEHNNYRSGRDPSGRRMASDSDARVNLSGRLTIVTKDDERLLLQTADGSPWALLPSVTRISLSTLEDFCFTTHQYCANKNQVVRPISNRSGSPGTECDGKCSSRRSNSETPGDHERHAETAGSEPPNVHEHAPRTSSSVRQHNGKSDEQSSSYVYYGENAFRGHTTLVSLPTEQHTSSPKRRKGLGRKKRKRERCFIEHIGTPPFLMGHRETFFGSWMQDASPRQDFDADKRWVTEHVAGALLFEYASPIDLKRGGSHGDAPVRTLDLPHMFEGTNHLVYNGSLIYQRAGSPIIIRYDLVTENFTETRIPGAACNGGDYLYNDESHNYFDLAMDENGLWVFFHYEKRKTLSVARLHPKTMRLIKIWNLTRFDHTQIGDTWVACGVMYVLDSRKAHTSRISVAYDLFRHRSAKVNMPWRNSYNLTTMVTYNPKFKRLHIYDNGFLLERNLLMAYPGRPGSIGPYG